jgi:DNA-binding SARP family transcriptional activator
MSGRYDNPAREPPGRFRAWLFGPFRVLRDNAEIADSAWGRRSAQTLLKWFLLNPSHPFSSAELCGVLWAGQSGTERHNKLHVSLYYLRRVLEPDLPGRYPSSFIRTDETGRYRFDPLDCWWIDVGEMERLWRSARASSERGDNDAAVTTLHRLLDYYGQGFLPEELYEDAFAHFRDAHDRRHDEVLHALLELHGDMNHRYEVLTCAQRILDRDPYSESAMTALVEVYLWQGNFAAAISELDRFFRILNDDLGVPPSRHLIALRERVGSPR